MAWWSNGRQRRRTPCGEIQVAESDKRKLIWYFDVVSLTLKERTQHQRIIRKKDSVDFWVGLEQRSKCRATDLNARTLVDRVTDCRVSACSGHRIEKPGSALFCAVIVRQGCTDERDARFTSGVQMVCSHLSHRAVRKAHGRIKRVIPKLPHLHHRHITAR